MCVCVCVCVCVCAGDGGAVGREGGWYQVGATVRQRQARAAHPEVLPADVPRRIQVERVSALQPCPRPLVHG